MRTLGLLLLSATLFTAAHSQEVDWKQVDDVLGRTATVTQDVHRYGFPRTDLNVTLDGVTIKPGFRARRLGRIQIYGQSGHGDG